MSGPFGSHNFMTSIAPPVPEGQSLRFNDDDSAYLSWTPATAGTLTKFTFSAWVKRGNLSSSTSDIKAIFGTNNGGSSFRDVLRFTDDNGTDILSFQHTAFSSYTLYTSAVFRDVSAWYHIVLSVDTTQATAADRVNIYVNGEAQTLSGTYPPQNNNTQFGRNCNQYLGARSVDGSTVVDTFDGYMSEVNFVDGAALDPTSFGETDANGQWVPIKEPSVTYGTNGFYLPFTNDYEVEGFNTVNYRGNGADQYIGGVGFEPDFLWVKDRTAAYNHLLVNSVTGVTNFLNSNTTNAESSTAGYITSTETDGFSLGSGGNVNASGNSYVAWAWDMGTGSAASNTDGSITSSVKASQTYGQSIVSYTGNGTAGATIGHGLSSAPEIIIVKNRDSLTNWFTYVSEIGAGNSLILNTTNASYAASILWNNTDPTTSVFSVGTATETNGSGNDIIAYCFHSVAGYSDIGSYTGNGSSTGPTVTTGFKPAFVMVKRTDSTGDWHILDNTRSPYGELDNYLYPNTSDAEYAGNNDGILITDTTFQLSNSYSALNASGGTYIYMAFADKREAAFWLDQSGNNNDWTNNNMQESDISLDSPTNNFCTLSSIDAYSLSTGYISLSEGNLKCNGGPTTGYVNCASTFYQNSGKWYVEWIETSRSAATRNAVGLLTQDTNHNGYISQYDEGYFYGDNGYFYYKTATGSATNYNTGTTFGIGDIIGYALDLDAGTLAMYKNNTLVYTYTGLDADTFYTFGAFGYNSSDNNIVNFGQDSSFAGNKVAQGNVDGNGFGDFYYEPPSGYLALCTSNLPDPAINDGTENFNTALWTGTGASNSITGVGFQPDLVWTKCRSVGTTAHTLHNVVSGVDKYLSSSRTNAESTLATIMTSFDSDGFTLGTHGLANTSGRTYVGWSWKAGGTGVANTDGSTSSTVSANQTSGFSVVGYTGNSTAGATIGHGLSSAPDMIIVKNRDGATTWRVYHSAEGATKYASLDTTSAFASATSVWNDTEPTSSVFTVGASTTTNPSGSNLIAYCFHSVEGYSKFGKYTGNGSTNGPFVYTGFRPAFVIYKRTDAAAVWVMHDTVRDDYNAMTKRLYVNQEDAEANSSTYSIDALSNGFKVRSSLSTVNASSGTYAYMAFAESPFKYSNAR